MMIALDLGLAAAGRSYALLSRGGRATRGARFVVVALIALTVVPLVVVALTPIPLEMSHEDLRDGVYPSRTSWLRLEGDLEDSTFAAEGFVTYILRDAANDELAVTVLAIGPLPIGHTEVTGQLLGGVRAPGTFDAFYADVPIEPARHDPWLLIGLPGLVALVLLVGERVGYPVVRRETRRGQRSPGLAPDERVAARWSGQIGSEDLPLGVARACTVTVAGGAETCTLTLVDDGGIRTVVARRATPKVVGRVCRTSGCRPGLEVHGPGADIVLECDSTTDRDRLAASLA